jgi:hypothetical protein
MRLGMLPLVLLLAVGCADPPVKLDPAAGSGGEAGASPNGGGGDGSSNSTGGIDGNNNTGGIGGEDGDIGTGGSDGEGGEGGDGDELPAGGAGGDTSTGSGGSGGTAGGSGGSGGATGGTTGGGTGGTGGSVQQPVTTYVYSGPEFDYGPQQECTVIKYQRFVDGVWKADGYEVRDPTPIKRFEPCPNTASCTEMQEYCGF